jgi:hypothetical protein
MALLEHELLAITGLTPVVTCKYKIAEHATLKTIWKMEKKFHRVIYHEQYFQEISDKLGDIMA